MNKQIWKKKGLIISPPNTRWGKTHCMLPTPIKISNTKYRIFFATRNKKNQSSISYADIKFDKYGIKDLVYPKKKSFTFGKLGHFDDNGVLPSSIIKIKNTYFMYYIGWQPRATTRYSLIAGLSFSNNGKIFKRYSNSPILENNNEEPISILTAPCVVKIKNKYLMWYVSGIKWKKKNFPLYDIKLATSKNGLDWIQTKKTCLKLKKNERALARPFVLFEKNKFCMWYSYEKKVGSYKIGYAESKNGINWKRLDNNININTSSKYEINMREYPSIISVLNKKYILYNGDDYGKKGILLAELEK